MAAATANALAGAASRHMRNLPMPPQWQHLLYREREPVVPPVYVLAYDDLIAIGHTLDALISTQAVVMGDASTRDLIPSLSAKAKVMVFRGPDQTMIHASLDLTQAQQRLDDWRAMTSASLSSETRAQLFQKYGVQFLLFCSKPPWLDTFPRAYPERITLVQQAGPLFLYRVR